MSNIKLIIIELLLGPLACLLLINIFFTLASNYDVLFLIFKIISFLVFLSSSIYLLKKIKIKNLATAILLGGFYSLINILVLLAYLFHVVTIFNSSKMSFISYYVIASILAFAFGSLNGGLLFVSFNKKKHSKNILNKS